VGENPFAITGGTGAVWIKANEAPGAVKLTAGHLYLGTRTVEIRVKGVPPELL
jgi:beta-galactosidase